MTTPGLVVRYVPTVHPDWLAPADPGKRSCTERAWSDGDGRPWLCDRDRGHDDDHASHSALGVHGRALAPMFARWPQEPPT